MLFELFITFFKIGLFTFGGGYAMISLVKEECIDKKKWIDNEEFLSLIAIAESTPGPIAINIGYKKCKMTGAILSTIGVVLPSLIVIYIIAVFFKDFLQIKIVADAFFGIRIAVSIIIVKTAFNLIKNEIKASNNKILTFILFFIYTVILFATDFYDVNISSLLLIISAILLGIIFILLGVNKSK